MFDQLEMQTLFERSGAIARGHHMYRLLGSAPDVTLMNTVVWVIHAARCFCGIVRPSLQHTDERTSENNTEEERSCRRKSPR